MIVLLVLGLVLILALEVWHERKCKQACDEWKATRSPDDYRKKSMYGA